MPSETLDRPHVTVTLRHSVAHHVRVFPFTSGRVDVEIGDGDHILSLGGDPGQLRDLLADAVRQLDNLKNGGRR